MSINVVTTEGVLASAVAATSGTVTVGYPSRPSPQVGTYTPGDFYQAMGHTLVMGNSTLNFPKDFDLTFNAIASSITVTNKTSSAWPAGTKYRLNLNVDGKTTYRTDNPGAASRGKSIARASRFFSHRIALAPSTASSNAIALSQTVTGAGTAFTLNGALVSGGVAYMDTPRNVVAAWTNTAVLTITGKDEYGNTMIEQSASGTSHTGKKAFAQITSITTSATITSATVGTGDVIGLPFFLAGQENVVGVAINGVWRPLAASYDFVIPQTQLLAPTAIYGIATWGGYIRRINTVVAAAITTGGTLQVRVGTTAAVGVVATIANSAAANSVVSAAATDLTGNDSTTLIADRGAFNVLPASFATAGAVNGTVEVNSGGVFTGGIRTAGGSTATSGDVRGTFKPPIACDGTSVFEIFTELGDPQQLGPDQYAG